MANNKMDEFHRLVAAERYREARGILETEPDIPPKVAEKWLEWLDNLHRDEWVQAGIISDQKKQNPQRALDDLGRMIGGTLAAVAACVGVWLVVNSVLTYQTASASGGTLFLLFALMGGYLGWQRAAAFFSSPRQSATVGAGVMMALLIYLASSGFPLWYYHEPPISYRLAAFALAAPVCAYVSYRAGALLGWGVVRLVSRESWSGQNHG